MGCISSKALCRSISIREEVSHGFERRTSAWEELLASHSGKDQLFAFVRSSNNVKTKLTSSSFILPTTAAEPEYLIPQVESPADDIDEPDLRRSKSCHLPREKDMVWISSSSEVNDNKLNWKDKNMVGSRSFHTVEEYDALLERIRKFGAMKDECSWEDVNLKQSNSGKDDEDSVGVRENGWKRKGVAKGLKSLDVSSSIEFPGVGRLKQRIGFDSPTAYITPKFGSYNGGPTQGGESRVFSPELVAAFEDCMQQLQVEEESILREMDIG